MVIKWRCDRPEAAAVKSEMAACLDSSIERAKYPSWTCETARRHLKPKEDAKEMC
jgi:hypothetical protein